MIKVTYTTRFSSMERTFDSHGEAMRYAVGIQREMNRVRVAITSLTVGNLIVIKP